MSTDDHLTRRALLAGVASLALAGSAAAEPEETGPTEATGQMPAFPRQTRAPKPAPPVPVRVTPLVSGLRHSWAMEFLPDGRILTTEKAGGMRIVAGDGRPAVPVLGVPRVVSAGQAGLLDVALGPSFAADGTIFFSFSEPRAPGNGTSVARARLVEDAAGARLDELRVIFRQEPSWTNELHFGSRIVVRPDGTLFVTVGERYDEATRVGAQDLRSGLGKVFRINPDGSAPADNPFVGRAGAVPQIWSYGHRNMQSAALDVAGRLWTVEHGPRGGDELNRPEPGKNYGWPEVTYGIDYDGRKIGRGITQKPGTEQPVYYWDPVIAPSGMDFYAGALFPDWAGAILIGGLRSERVVVLRMRNDRVATEQWIPIGARVRDVKAGPDGALYALTEQDAGGSRILRITPG